MRPGSRYSLLFVVSAQIAAFVAPPVAVCCLSGSENVHAEECPHEMDPGAYCPMHHQGEDEPTDDPITALRTCGMNRKLLAWIYTLVAPREPAELNLESPLAWTPMPVSSFLTPIQPASDPPSPPPRA